MGLIGNIKRTNLCIMGAPEGEEKEKRRKLGRDQDSNCWLDKQVKQAVDLSWVLREKKRKGLLQTVYALFPLLLNIGGFSQCSRRKENN